MTDQLKELKAAAYDVIAQIQFHQQKLAEMNQQIAELAQQLQQEQSRQEQVQRVNENPFTPPESIRRQKRG